MTRGTAFVLLCTSLSCATSALPAGAAEAAEVVASSPRNIVIVTMPRLRWQDVTASAMPTLHSLVQQAAVANLSVRTVTSRTTLEDAYATIGAGNRAVAGPLGAAAFDAVEQVDNSTACESYSRRVGTPCRGDVLQLGIADATAANAARLYGAVPGALGDALSEAGVTAAVFGNADGPVLSPAARLYAADPTAIGGGKSGAGDQPGASGDGALGRGVATSMMRSDGTVDIGDVSESLLVEDATRPYGVRLSTGRVIDRVRAELPRARVIAVEASDLERADRARSLASPAQRTNIWRRERRAADRLLAGLMQVAPPSTTRYIVLAPAAPRAGEQLTVFATFGAGVEPGLATSPNTRRAGYVTLVDVAPTVIDAIGGTRPPVMSGRPITTTSATSGTSADAIVDGFVTDNLRAVARDDFDQPAFVVFILAMTVLFAVSIVMLWKRSTGSPVLAFLGIWAATIPVATFLLTFLPFERGSGALSIVAISGLALLLAAGCWLTQRWRPAAPVAAVCSLTLAVLLADLVLGSRLEFNSMLGYSPIVAGRFTGIGNLGYSLVVASAIVLAAIVVSWFGTGAATMTAIGIGFAVVVTIIGAPGWGADVGGVIAGVPTFVIAWLLLARVAIRWKTVLFAIAAMVFAVAAFAIFDLAQPAAQQTHLARLVQSTVEGGGGALVTVLRRKLDANVRILLVSDYVFILPVTIAFIVALAYTRVGLRDMFKRWPTLERAGWALIAGGVIGMAVNDSGAAIPAMMLWLVAPLLLYLRATTGANGMLDVDHSSHERDHAPDDSGRDEAGRDDGAVRDVAAVGSETRDADAGSVSARGAEAAATTIAEGPETT